MPGEIFNPNPVVFSASKNSGRKVDVSVHSLWIDDTNQLDDETDEVEAIDQDEIFGNTDLAYQPHTCTNSSCANRSHSLDIRPRTPEHP